MKEYNPVFDFIKGIGIFLVVLGHTLCPSHFLINVFHMPLFFFISGMTFHDPDDIRNFILKKINRIMVPYVFFTSPALKQVCPNSAHCWSPAIPEIGTLTPPFPPRLVYP